MKYKACHRSIIKKIIEIFICKLWQCPTVWYISLIGTDKIGYGHTKDKPRYTIPYLWAHPIYGGSVYFVDNKKAILIAYMPNLYIKRKGAIRYSYDCCMFKTIDTEYDNREHLIKLYRQNNNRLRLEKDISITNKDTKIG